MLGRTDGTSPDVASAMLASRGSRLFRWFGSTTTVISMGSSCAKPAARRPVKATREGSGGQRGRYSATVSPGCGRVRGRGSIVAGDYCASALSRINELAGVSRLWHEKPAGIASAPAGSFSKFCCRSTAEGGTCCESKRIARF